MCLWSRETDHAEKDVQREEQALREKVTRAGEGKALTVTTRRQESDERAEGDP